MRNHSGAVALLAALACGNNPATKDATTPVAAQIAEPIAAPVAGPSVDPPAKVVVEKPPPPQPVPGIAKPTAPPREELITIPTRPGVTISALVLRPTTAPTHVVILLAGGSGRIGLSPRGIGKGAQDNFLVRTRERLVGAGFVVALVDVPSDRRDGLEGFRSTEDATQDYAALVRTLRDRHPVPVWMIGISRGAISAANAAARLGTSGPDGVVLLSTITTGRNETITDVPLDKIAVPTLVVQHRGDGCKASPPAAARALIRKLRRTAIHRLLLVGKTGGRRETDPCEALTRHGYLGIEDDVVAVVIAFVKSPAPE